MVIEKIVMCDNVWFGCAIMQWCLCDCAKNGELICFKKWWKHFWMICVDEQWIELWKNFRQSMQMNNKNFLWLWILFPSWMVCKLICVETWEVMTVFLLKLVEEIGERMWFTIRVGREEKNKYFNKIRNIVSRPMLVCLRKEHDLEV